MERGGGGEERGDQSGKNKFNLMRNDTGSRLVPPFFPLFAIKPVPVKNYPNEVTAREIRPQDLHFFARSRSIG